MSDPTTLARTARENLARGLGALQSPGLPDALGGVAEPVAAAMSALHRIEASQGAALAEAAPQALDAVRRALAMLQTHADSGIPAVNQATEAVASSLGLVHSLSQGPAPAQAVAPPQPAAPQAAPAFPQQQFAQPQAAPQAAPYQQPAFPQPGLGGTAVMDPGPQQPQPAAGWGAPQQPAQPQMPQAQPVAAYGPPPGQQQQGGWQQPQQAWPAQAAPVPAAGSHPQAAAHAGSHPHAASHPQAAAGSHPQAAAGPAQPLQVPAGTRRLEANLGAHSPTNFYKGLSGNDVIDSGGIFVATYQIPKLNESVAIHVTLPGGYEFEALAVVEWIRETPNSTADGLEAPPGFGAKFSQISPEGRQLVYRYVRNREPLFHDDL